MTATGPLPSDPRQLLTLLDLSGSDHGHRRQYKEFLQALFPARVCRFGIAALFARGPVLVTSIEESLLRYLATCLLRSLLPGRRTAGFLLRPRPALEGKTLRLRFKRTVLCLLRALPRVTTLTILPFAVEPGFARIADDWIYDLQIWDLHAAGTSPGQHRPGPLAQQIQAAAHDRPVVCAVGRQVAEKGFDVMSDLYCGDAGLRGSLLMAYGGMVDATLAGHARRFAQAGGFGCDRMVSDDELLDLYAAADLVWCVYAADYDQASGILGRAMQYGIPVAVRPGSLAERLCAQEGLACIAIDEAADTGAFAAIPPREDAGAARARSLRHRAESIARLGKALGMAARPAS